MLLKTKHLSHVKRRAAAITMVAGAFIFGACADDGPAAPDRGPNDSAPEVEIRSIERPVMSRLLDSPPMLIACGPAVKYSLWADRPVPGGSVTVTNDAENLYVTYTVTDPDWYITDTRLAVSKTVSKIPTGGQYGMPNPWAFPYAGEHEPAVKSLMYTVSLSSIGARAGDSLVVAAMAGVVYPKTGSYSGPWEWRTAWGIGNINGNSLATLHNYQVAACGTTPTQPPASQLSGGVITITFDDGWRETHDLALPILKQLGLRGNAAVNPQPIDGGWEAYMTLDMVRKLHAEGWSIVSHSVTHRDLTTLTDGELESELVDSKAWIARNGFGESPVFIVPFHSWGARERGRIEQHYAAARGYTATQFWPAKMVSTPITESYDLTGFEPEYAPFTTAEGRALTMSYVKRAVDENEFIDLFFHHITPAQEPAFRQLMTEVAAYRANVKTFNEIF